MFFRMINHGYKLFAIVKSFSFRLLWTGSCFAFMFIMPVFFEIFSEQEAVLDKIQRDDMIAQASDMGGFGGGLGGAAQGAPNVRPF